MVFSHLLKVLGRAQDPDLTRWGISELGALGVLMFFIHTSLVLMMSLERLSASGGAYVRAFYLRRVFRIYPLSIFTVLVVVGLRIPDYFEQTFTSPGTKGFLANLFLVQNITGPFSVIGPLWSLPFEVQMYLLLPLIFLVARRARSYGGAGLLVLGGFALWWLEARIARVLHYPALFTYAPWFAMGSAVYALSRFVRPVWSATAYLSALSAFVVLSCVNQRVIGDYRTGWVLWGLGIAFSFLLPHCNDVTSAPLRLVSHKIATYSYGIYLCHVPVLWFAFMKLDGIPPAARSAVCIVMLVVVPVVLYHLIEAPMIGLGVRLAGSFAPRRS